MSNTEWISLFDGQSLEGWSTTGKPEGWTAPSHKGNYGDLEKLS